MSHNKDYFQNNFCCFKNIFNGRILCWPHFIWRFLFQNQCIRSYLSKYFFIFMFLFNMLYQWLCTQISMFKCQCIYQEFISGIHFHYIVWIILKHPWSCRYSVPICIVLMLLYLFPPYLCEWCLRSVQTPLMAVPGVFVILGNCFEFFVTRAL